MKLFHGRHFAFNCIGEADREAAFEVYVEAQVGGTFSITDGKFGDFLREPLHQKLRL